MTVVKVCGMTREEDVTHAVTLGVDWLGFIHVPDTPRFVDEAALARLLPKAVGVTRVVVVRNAAEAHLAHLRNTLDFEYFQFHGDEPETHLAKYGGYRVFHMGREQAEAPHTFGSPFLLDTSVKGQRGGTGKTFNWQVLAQMKGDFLVAGGLNPDNVGELIAGYQPWGIDVSSGVEASPGTKDHHKLKRFIENARRQSRS